MKDAKYTETEHFLDMSSAVPTRQQRISLITAAKHQQDGDVKASFIDTPGPGDLRENKAPDGRRKPPELIARLLVAGCSLSHGTVFRKMIEHLGFAYPEMEIDSLKIGKKT